ncbi:outer membrane protein, partial [Rhizobium ruizarguesonis]
GGLERALTDNIMMRAEYRYDDFGLKDFGSALGDFEVNQQKVTISMSSFLPIPGTSTSPPAAAKPPVP